MNLTTNSKSKAILEAALVLFAERGYDGTTVPMIADKAHVGAGTIYRYFENKEALVNALFQYCVKDFSSRLSRYIMDDTLNIREQFRQIFHTMVEYAEENIEGLLFIESHNNAYYLDDTSSKLFNEMLDNVRDVLERGKKLGFIKDFISDALICIVYGAFVQLFKLINKGVLDKNKELIDGVEESCWSALKI